MKRVSSFNDALPSTVARNNQLYFQSAIDDEEEDEIRERREVGTKAFPCGDCDKSFKFASGLRDHTYKHTGKCLCYVHFPQRIITL